jgi:long-chain acyl-CoA synthetase
VEELLYHRMILPSADRNADRPCLTDAATGSTATFAEHLDHVSRVAGALRDLGVGRSDRFAVLALNSPEYVQLYHASFLGGGVINPLNLRFAPKELGYVLRDSGTKVCFVDAWFAPLLEQVKAEAGVDHVVLIGGGDVPHTASFDEVVGAATPTIPDEGEETDPAVLMYTGGTTGMPKGVVLDQRAEMLNAYHILMTIRFSRDDVAMLQTPLFHAASVFNVLAGPGIGAHTVTVPTFEPAAVMNAAERYSPSWTVMVPTMIGLMIAHPEFAPERLSALENLVYGASPMPQALLEKLFALFPDLNIWQAYGMTEGGSVLTVLGPDEHRAGGKYLRSAGAPLTGVVLSIRDGSDREVPVGEPGEVCARGGNFMVEYWQQPDSTTEAFRNGWYHTGDTGYLDDEGYLYLVDRVKDMIVTGGENVYSIEVENALAFHPAVLQVAVIGIPHASWGEAVHAIIVLREGATATEEDLLAHARREIAGYKVPKSIEFRSEPLPLSGAMKILKRDLRAPYWEGRERGIN